MRSTVLINVIIVCTVLISYSIPGHSEDSEENYLGWDFRIAAGVGQTNQPLVGASDKVTSVGPRVYFHIAYYGERFFFDEDGIGYNLFSDDSIIVNVLGELTDDAALFDDRRYNTDNEELADLEKRNYGFLAGIQMFVDRNWGILESQVLTDITGTHNGQEIKVAYEYLFESGNWLVAPSAGFRWKSHNLVDYYYGVRGGEVKEGRPEYEGKASLNLIFHFYAEFSIAQHWNVVSEFYYERGDNGIHDSPLVQDKYFSEVLMGVEFVY